MPKRIKLPVGRHGHGHVGKSELVRQKNAASDAEKWLRTQESRIRSNFDRQPTELGRRHERVDWESKWKYQDSRRPPGVGHLTNDPVLSEPSKVQPEGTWSTHDAVVMDPFACGAKPVLVEDEDWTRRKVMVNKSSFPTTYLPWITCQHCLVLIDWGMTYGYLELNALKEAVDPLPDATERKKLRKHWRRLLRARREPEQEG